MEYLPIIGSVLALTGALVAVAATMRGQSTARQDAQLAQAWTMQKNHMDMLIAENKELKEQKRLAEADRYAKDKLYDDCYEARRQLEIQVELLKLQRGAG